MRVTENLYPSIFNYYCFLEYSQISIEFSIENKSEKTNQSKIKLKFKEFISFGLPDMKATQFCLTMIKRFKRSKMSL